MRIGRIPPTYQQHINNARDRLAKKRQWSSKDSVTPWSEDQNIEFLTYAVVGKVYKPYRHEVDYEA